MNILAKNIADAFLETTCLIFDNDFSNIQKVKLCWHHLNFLTFSVMNHSLIFNVAIRDNDSINEALFNMHKMNLLPDGSWMFYIDHKNIVLRLLEQVININTFGIDRLNLSLLHECLLSIDLKISKKDIGFSVGKSHKDIAGAYYTPNSLAKTVVEEAFGKFEKDCTKQLADDTDSLKAKLQVDGIRAKYQNISIADLSCGGGEFYRAAQGYLLEKFAIPLNVSCTFFWGIDVDPIALQITICNLLSVARQEDWNIIISHFILGNPIVNAKKECSDSEKSDMFALNRIYAEDMGIDFTRIFNDKRFDIVLGNPPWEKIRFEERKFFANICPEIAAISKKDKRHYAIENLQIQWPNVYEWAKEVTNDYNNMSSRTFQHPLITKTVVGELNTYALFTELAFELTKPYGVCALIVKSALVTSPVNRAFWNMLVTNCSVYSLYLFENKQKIFDIDLREKFCVITLLHHSEGDFKFAAGLLTAKDMAEKERFYVQSNDLDIINPFTSMVPNVANTADMQVLLDAHNRLPLFKDVYADCHFGRLIHLTAHAEHIDTELTDSNLPIYEGKFIEQYDARFSTFASLDVAQKYSGKASAIKNADFGTGKPLPESRYFIKKDIWDKYKKQYPEKYSLCWRSLTSNTNARTTIAMILPTCPTCQSIQMLQVEDAKNLLELLGLFNSIPFDYFVRLKMPGIDLTQSVIKQIPVPPKKVYKQDFCFQGYTTTLERHIFSYLYYILRKEPLIHGLLDEVNYPIYAIDVSDVATLDVRKTLDFLFATAYGLSVDDFADILATFPKY
ncbi:MAG: hypothetical protein AB9858_06325 [Acidaminococcaceae bacterium]